MLSLDLRDRRKGPAKGWLDELPETLIDGHSFGRTPGACRYESDVTVNPLPPHTPGFLLRLAGGGRDWLSGRWLVWTFWAAGGLYRGLLDARCYCEVWLAVDSRTLWRSRWRRPGASVTYDDKNVMQRGVFSKMGD